MHNECARSKSLNRSKTIIWFTIYVTCRHFSTRIDSDNIVIDVQEFKIVSHVKKFLGKNELFKVREGIENRTDLLRVLVDTSVHNGVPPIMIGELPPSLQILGWMVIK